MEFFDTALSTIQTCVMLLGGGVALWGGIALLDGYSNDNGGAKSSGFKQVLAGGGIMLISMTLIPALGNML